jgi:hypothetical protein
MLNKTTRAGETPIANLAKPAPAPFFVVGSDRSGTTMLMMMLDAHPQLGVARESWFLIELMNALPLKVELSRENIQSAYQIISRHPRWRNWEVPDAALKNCLDSLQKPDLGTLIEAVFRLDQRLADKPRLGDKTPAYVLEMERLREVFPDARFIHLIRDARDVCVSLRKVGWHGPTVVHMARYWRRHVETGIRAGQRLGNDAYLQIPYESIVADVEGSLRAICRFLEIPFDRGLLSWHERAAEMTAAKPMRFQSKIHRAPRPEDLERWKDELPTIAVAAVECMAGDIMHEVGQSRRFGRGVRMLYPLFMIYATSMSGLKVVWRTTRKVLRL